MSRVTRAFAAVALAAAAVSPALAGAPSASAAPQKDVAFEFTDDRIESSSGLTVSAAEPDYVFTVNDSGPTRVFAITPENGRSYATMRLDNAENVDWEGIAAGKGRSLWVGDIGDNESRRPNITVYRFQLPQPVQTGHYVAKKEYRLSYPDGAHDAEALLVNPTTNAVYVVTKDAKGGALYKAPAPLSEGNNELTKIGGKMPAMVTDGAFTPDGKQFALRSYTNAHVYETATGDEIGSFALPKQEQGEGMTYTSDGGSMLLSSEGAGSEVLRLNVEEALATGSKAPSASNTPSAAKTEEAGGTEEDGIDLVNALFIAGPFAIALLAAAAAFLLHRRRAAPEGAHSGGGGGRRGAGRYERDQPYPPPSYGAVPDVEDEEDGWPVPSSARRRSDFEDTRIGPPPFLDESGPQAWGTEPPQEQGAVPSFQGPGGPPPPSAEPGGPPPSFHGPGGPAPFQEPGGPASFQEPGAPPPVFQPEAAPPPQPAPYEPDHPPGAYQNGTHSYQQDAAAPPAPPPPPPPADGGGGRRAAQPGRRGGRSGQGKRKRGQRGDDGEPFWLRE